MEKTESAVRSRLLEAGKEEFRDKGFLKASLRAICKKADVTTGALYFFFESKAALFEEIVEETVGEMEQIAGKLTDSQNEEQTISEEYDQLFMEFVWENRDIARILMEGAEGTDMKISGRTPAQKWNSFFRRISGKNAEKKQIMIWYIS